MRAVVVAVTLFLVVLMSMPDSGAGWMTHSWKIFCKNRIPQHWCKNGWRKLDPHRCIKVFSTAKTYYNAEHHCLQSGGNLVSILNHHENNVVTCEALKTSNRMIKYWIGAKKKVKFEWRDGHGALKYTRWAVGKPDNWGGKENCVEINYHLWGRWNDNECSKKKPYICQLISH